jgi:hypothetical protein
MPTSTRKSLRVHSFVSVQLKTFKTANDRAVQGLVAKGIEAEQKHRKNFKTIPHLQLPLAGEMTVSKVFEIRN